MDKPSHIAEKDWLSKLVVVLYFSIVFLLPFSRYSEIPLLLLSGIGAYTLSLSIKDTLKNRQFVIYSIIYACYLLMILISAVDSFWPQKTYIVAAGSIRFWLAGLCLILIPGVRHHLRWLLTAVALLAVFWSIDALIQQISGTNLFAMPGYPGRLTGVFSSNVKLGPVLAIMLPFALLWSASQHVIIRWTSIVLITCVILLSGTRSAWLMMGFILIMYWWHHVPGRRLLLLFKVSFFACALTLLLWLVSADFQNRVHRSLEIFKGDTSAIDFALADRIPIWNTAIEMFVAHPVNGVGARAFRKAYPVYADSNDVWVDNGGVGLHAHHWLLEIMAETGILGLLCMLIAVLVLLKYLRPLCKNTYIWPYAIALMTIFLPIISTYSLFSSFWGICIWWVMMGIFIRSKDA